MTAGARRFVARSFSWPLLVLALGCNGALRFDQDSGAIADACGAGGCDFSMVRCDGGNCLLICLAGTTCAGSCGSSCAARCEENSMCSLVTGASSNLECENHGNCSATLGPGSELRCESDAVCHARCPGPCLLSCEPGATCFISCGGEADRAVTSSTVCP